MATNYPTAVANAHNPNGILLASVGAVTSIHLCLLALPLQSPMEIVTAAKPAAQSVEFLFESAPTAEPVQPQSSHRTDTPRRLVRHTPKPKPQTAEARVSPPQANIEPVVTPHHAPPPAQATLPSPTMPVEIKPATPIASANGSTNLKPEYPRLSRRLGEQGLVRLRLLVLKSGEVAKVEVLQSSGFHRLDLAAAETVRQWHFEPATQGKQAIDNWQNQTIVFELN